MPLNIDTFSSKISGSGYLTTNKFSVIMSPPPILFNASINNTGTTTQINNIANDISFRIENIRTPGISLINGDVNRYGVGPTQKQPISAQFSETSISILSDGYGHIWQFWHNWLRGIFEFTGTTRSNVGISNKVPTYTSEYKNNYSTTIQIIIYDLFGNVIQKINLFEAFPISMNEIGLNWSDRGDLLRLNINLTYTEYTLESVNV